MPFQRTCCPIANRAAKLLFTADNKFYLLFAFTRINLLCDKRFGVLFDERFVVLCIR